ncbi:MAG: hypothetical protein KJO69_11360 [Gammaproteobacteria bacterium]|nr:hypothetical protein [Gammaproteobacteria bacterium]
MNTIHFKDFKVGLDHRKSSTVAEPDRLRELKNAFITTGNVIRKRPGMPKIATLESGTVGLISGNGYLNTFFEYGGGITHADTRFLANELEHALGAAYASGDLYKVHYGTTFLGYLYIAAEYDDSSVFHYYLDGSNPNRITDANCPNTTAVSKQESRIWAVDGDVVRYSVLNDPTDWTTVVPAAEDAGLIGTGLKSQGSADALALGQYDGRLAVFMIDGMQLWTIGTDVLTDLAFYKYVGGVGCKYAQTPTVFAGDVIFLNRTGFRSITTQSYADNLADVDVGSPIDKLVRAEIGDATDPRAKYFMGKNQFWCAYTLPSDPTKTRAWVYSYSKSAKVAAWSKYEIDFPLNDMEVHEGYLHVRSGDDVYRVDETDTVFTDGGNTFDMEASFPFIDCKTPGIDKYFASMDFTIKGTVDVAFRYDPNDETKITNSITITGDTRPLQRIPIEITGPAIAPVFTSTSDAEVQIDAFDIHYENLG